MWEVIFWVLLVPVLIIMGIMYGTSKKLFKLFAVLATYTYVIFIAYIIDVFELNRNWVLGLLVFSALLMIFLGWRLGKRDSEKKSVKSKSLKSRTKNDKLDNRWLWLVLLTVLLMVVIIVFSALNIGVKRTVTTRNSITESEINSALNSTTEPEVIPLANFTYENNGLLPAVIPDQSFTACWYNEKSGEYGFENLRVSINGAKGRSFETLERHAREVKKNEKVTLRVSVWPTPPLNPDTEPMTPNTDRGQNKTLPTWKDKYDSIVLASRTGDNIDCEELGRKRSDLKSYHVFKIVGFEN